MVYGRKLLRYFNLHPIRAVRRDSKEETQLKKEKLKRMTGIALLIALVVVMQSISSVIPPVSGFTISLVLIPIVLGAAIYGPGAGALLGGVFGVIVYMNCITGSDVGGQMVFQASPGLCLLVVVGKGILAGFAAGLVYRLIGRIANGYVAMLCAAVVCPVVNTGVFLLSMVTVFNDVINTWAGSVGADLMTYIFSFLLLLNFVPELIINVAFSPAGQRILQVLRK